LITDENGNKLSKSVGSESLKFFRETGQMPLNIIELARNLLGLPNEKIETTEELVQLCFSFKPFLNE
jgi:hypothetical protein